MATGLMAMGVEVKDLEVALGRYRIVNQVSFSLKRGNWLGVIGANGSGKTTLLRAICGRLPCVSGNIVIDDIDCSHNRADRAMAIGFAPDNQFLPTVMTGNEVFGFVRDGSEHRESEFDLSALYLALGLNDIAHRRIGTCSAGMRQRVAIYCAFVSGAPIAILDEPFNWLDPLAAYDVRTALKNLVQQGFTLITALHDLGTLVSACDVGMMMRDGLVALHITQDDIARAAADPMQFEREMMQHLRHDTIAALPQK
jgi:ABC-type multidrug transport system ATPase subunit